MRLFYLDIDSLRPDHLGCYGYGRNTSPHIDAIAARGDLPHYLTRLRATERGDWANWLEERYPSEV